MEFQLNPNLNNISWEKVCLLITEVGWEKRNPEEIKSAFEQSAYTCFILENGKLIGFGRTLDDSKYYAVIVDVVIDPNHQGKGLGTQIVTRLKDCLSDYLFVTLSAAPGKGGFYQKLGWKKQRSAFIWPINAQQEKDHCE